MHESIESPGIWPRFQADLERSYSTVRTRSHVADKPYAAFLLLAINMPPSNEQPTSQRKQATIIFADLSGFTAMSENLDPEQVREIVNRYFEGLSAAVRRYDGTIDKYIGDCVMAVFGVPVTRENDAERACRAALDMQEAVRVLANDLDAGVDHPPQLHVGINTGLVVAAAMGSAENSQFTVMGDAVNLASRLCHEATDGQIAVGDSCWERVRDYFEFAAPELRTIKGKSEKVPVHFLLRRTGKLSSPRRTSIPMVGRKRELCLVEDLLKHCKSHCGKLLCITGESGIGKSRFVQEASLQAADSGFSVVSAAAGSLETLQPYGLWQGVLQQLAGPPSASGSALSAADLEASLRTRPWWQPHQAGLRATLGLESPEIELLDETNRFGRIFAAWRAVLASLQAQAPVLLVLDDVQWADTQSMQLLNAAADLVPSMALLLCCTARQEFGQEWSNRSYYKSLVLQPLSAEESAELARKVLKPGKDQSRELEVVARAEGNPFYLVELAKAAPPGSDSKLPPTIEGVILEKIDRLEGEARRVLELASVIGREFPERLLREIAGVQQLEEQLLRLRELEFLYEKEIAPELSYLFKHYLTQEATYNSMLIRRRKELHKQVGAAIENVYKDALECRYSLLARHYEKAEDYQRAFEYYRLAGEKAQQTQSDAAAVKLYERGESALQSLYESRSGLRNKRNSFLIILLAGLLAPALVFLAGWLNAMLHSWSGWHPDLQVLGYSSLITLGAAGVSMAVMAGLVKRWSFLVYPDRIRVRGRRRSLEVPFAQIRKVDMISYRHRPTPGVLWTELKIYCNPRYPKFGMGQMGVLRGVREVIRIDCTALGWKKGYFLEVDEPRAFFSTLNRALTRHRTIAQARDTASFKVSAST